MPVSTITSKGQTTIPIEIRELLDLKPGDKLAFDVEGRKVTLRAKNLPVTALKGIVKSPFKRPLTRKQEREGIDRYLDEKYGPKRPK